MGSWNLNHITVNVEIASTILLVLLMMCGFQTRNCYVTGTKTCGPHELHKSSVLAINYIRRSSRRKCFIKKLFLKISQNSQEKTFVGVSFLTKLQALGTGELWHRCFPVNFVKIVRTPSSDCFRIRGGYCWAKLMHPYIYFFKALVIFEVMTNLDFVFRFVFS